MDTIKIIGIVLMLPTIFITTFLFKEALEDSVELRDEVIVALFIVGFFMGLLMLIFG